MDEQKQEQLNIRKRARQAYEERAGEIRARMLTQRKGEDRFIQNWVLDTFGVPLSAFAAEGITAIVCRYRDGRPYGLQIEGSDPFTGKPTWSAPCTTWAELGEQLDPDTFTPDDPDDIADPDTPTSTWADDLLDAIERGLIEHGRL